MSVTIFNCRSHQRCENRRYWVMKLSLLSVGVCAVLIFSVQTGSAQTPAPGESAGMPSGRWFGTETLDPCRSCASAAAARCAGRGSSRWGWWSRCRRWWRRRWCGRAEQVAAPPRCPGGGAGRGAPGGAAAAPAGAGAPAVRCSGCRRPRRWWSRRWTEAVEAEAVLRPAAPPAPVQLVDLRLTGGLDMAPGATCRSKSKGHWGPPPGADFRTFE